MLGLLDGFSEATRLILTSLLETSTLLHTPTAQILPFVHHCKISSSHLPFTLQLLAYIFPGYREFIQVCSLLVDQQSSWALGFLVQISQVHFGQPGYLKPHIFIPF